MTKKIKPLSHAENSVLVGKLNASPICPFCKIGVAIRGNPNLHIHTSYYVSVNCNGCNARWTEKYTLSCVKILVE